MLDVPVPLYNCTGIYITETRWLYDEGDMTEYQKMSLSSMGYFSKQIWVFSFFFFSPRDMVLPVVLLLNVCSACGDSGSVLE